MKGAVMAETPSTDSTKTKKGTNPLLFVGIGCIVLLVVFGVVISFAMKFFAKQIGTGIVQNVIEQKTGVKTNISDLEKGKVSFTDEKTGAKVDIGGDKLPDNFPKDFPVYPGAKVTGVISGSNQGASDGLWVTLTTTDTLDKVSAFYTASLKTSGWKETATYTAGDTKTTTVTKDKRSGTVGITRSEGSKETEIVIMLGEET
jgi:hypothetical protein